MLMYAQYFCVQCSTPTILKAGNIKKAFSWVMVAHTYKPNTQETEAGISLSLEVSLVYSASCRTVRSTHRNPFP